MVCLLKFVTKTFILMDFIEIIFKVSKFLLFLMWMLIVCVLSSIHCYNYEFLIICVHMRRILLLFFFLGHCSQLPCSSGFHRTMFWSFGLSLISSCLVSWARSGSSLPAMGSPSWPAATRRARPGSRRQVRNPPLPPQNGVCVLTTS